jgi:hypothetical protein
MRSAAKRLATAANRGDAAHAHADRRIRVRKMTLRLADLCRSYQQMSLFEESPNAKWTAAGKAMDRIRDRFGESAVALGRAMA